MRTISLTKNDEKRVLTSISKNKHAVRNRAVIMIGLYAGLRAKEIASLKVSNIVEADGTMKGFIRLNTEQTKGRKSRTVAVNKKLLEALTGLLEVLENKKQTASLIQSQRGSKFTSNTITQLVKNVFVKANLTEFTAHSLRRTFITRLADNAVNIKAIQELVGHSNLSVTSKYICLTEKHLVNAVNTL